MEQSTNTIDCVFYTVPGLLHGSESCGSFQGPAVFQPSGFTDEPHPRFPVQGHILRVGGDALSPPSHG